MTPTLHPEPIYHKPAEDEPGMILDPNRELFEFSGRSMPEDPASFFIPVLEWVREYARYPNDLTEVHFRMEYYNSASARFFTEFLQELEAISNTGHKVRICWWYDKEDQAIQERGEELQSVIDLEFEFRENPIP